MEDQLFTPRIGYLFIITYGRSGSTLLQGILNSIPGYLIRGENRAMMHLLFRYHLTAKNEQAEIKSAQPLTPAHPFFGIDGYQDRDAYRAIRHLALDTILRPTRGTRVVGFKEIRWDQQPRLEEYVKFLGCVFPGARFIINTRDHEAVSRSKWWAETRNALDKLAKLEARFLALADELGDAAYHVHYDDYVADPTSLRSLYAWLGADFDEPRVREVMARPHSY